MCKSDCGRQFQCRSFSFRCATNEKELFYRSQWCENRRYFLAYRLSMCLYALGWSVAYLINAAIQAPHVLSKDHRYLTRWGGVAMTIYFILAFALAVVGYLKKNKLSFEENGATKCLRSAVWMFHSVTFNCSFLVSVGYWALLASQDTNVSNVFNIHLHTVTAVMVLIDACISAIPVRLFHAIYAILFLLVYLIWTLIMHGTGMISRVYPYLDWAENPGMAAGVALGIAFGVPLVMQSLLFGLYSLRVWIAESCSCRTNCSTGPNEEAEAYNPAFELGD